MAVKNSVSPRTASASVENIAVPGMEGWQKELLDIVNKHKKETIPAGWATVAQIAKAAKMSEARMAQVISGEFKSGRLDRVSVRSVGHQTYYYGKRR